MRQALTNALQWLLLAALLVICSGSLRAAVAPATKTASGDFLFNTSEVLGDFEAANPDGIGSDCVFVYDPVSGVFLYAYCHNDPIGKYDYLGLAERYVTDPENPITRLADGTLMVNEVMRVRPSWNIFKAPYLDRSRTRQRPIANSDYGLWTETAPGVWGPTSYARDFQTVSNGVSNSLAPEIAKFGAVSNAVVTTAFAAPIVATAGGAILLEGGIATYGTGTAVASTPTVLTSGAGLTATNVTIGEIALGVGAAGAVYDVYESTQDPGLAALNQTMYQSFGPLAPYANLANRTTRGTSIARQRVMANLAESASARESSGFRNWAYTFDPTHKPALPSVAFEATLPSTMYPGTAARYHFREANTQLLDSLDDNPALGMLIPNLETQLIRPRSISTEPPSGWTWHHGTEPGQLWLTPSLQHWDPEFWPILHPNNRGGMSIWGGGY